MKKCMWFKIFCNGIVLMILYTTVSIQMIAQASGSIPCVFNWSETAKPGEVIAFQGSGFGTVPQVKFRISGSGTEYDISAITASDTYVAAVVPTNIPFGMYVVRIKNGTSYSDYMYINRIKPTTVEYDEVAPSTQFRIFGRNMYASGFTPTIKFVNDNNAGEVKMGSIVTGQSDAYTLTAIVPSNLTIGVTYKVYVDNGFVTGSNREVLCEEKVLVRAGGEDSFNLGTPWGADFAPFSNDVINVTTDPRLAVKAIPNDSQDDRMAIQAAIDLAKVNGGVVYLPQGSYNLTWTTNEYGLSLGSKVVLKGDGKDKDGKWRTTIQINGPEINAMWAVSIAEGYTTCGICDIHFQTMNTGLQDNFRAWGLNNKFFMKNVRWDFGTGSTIAMGRSKNMMITDCNFVATGRREIMELYNGSSYYWIRNNQYVFNDGRIECGVNIPAYHLYFEDNVFQRNAAGQVVGNGKEGGGIEFSGCKDMLIKNNTFEVINGTLAYENDGEVILTQYTSPAWQTRGTVTGVSGLTISDSSQSFGTLKTNQIIAIVDGVGTGQWRSITSNTATSITIDRAWDVPPTVGSKYAVTVWSGQGGTCETLIQGNTLRGSRRGIWLYGSTAEITVVENRLENNEGIYVRASHYPSETGRFNLSWNDYIADNIVEDTNDIYPAYIAVYLPQLVDSNNIPVSQDLSGTGILGVEVRRNTVRAYEKGNNNTVASGGMKKEGFINVVRYEGISDYSTPDGTTQGVLGTVFDKNNAINIEDPFTVGTGVYQTVICDTSYRNCSDNKLADIINPAAGHGAVATTMIEHPVVVNSFTYGGIKQLIPGNITFNISVKNNTDSSREATLIAALYKDNQLIEMRCTRPKILTNSLDVQSLEGLTITIPVMTEQELDKYKLKVLFFDNLINCMPYSPPLLEMLSHN